MRIQNLMIAALLGLLVFSSSAISQTQLQFTMTGTGSGSQAGTAFSSKGFTVTGVFTPYAGSGTSTGTLPVTYAKVVVNGVGTFELADSLQPYIFATPDTLGFGIGMRDLYNAQGILTGTGYTLDEPLGTLTGDGGWLLQWADGVATSGGVLDFTDENGITATVKVEKYTPPPATPVPALPLFGLGILVSLLGLFGLRKLRQ